jgi:hypothetical protein
MSLTTKTEKMIVGTDEEPADQLTKLPDNMPDGLTAVEQPLEAVEKVEEDVKTKEPSAVGADVTGKVEIVESAILGNGDEPTSIKQPKPESHKVNTVPGSEANANPIKKNSADISASEVFAYNVNPSKNSNSVQESQIVVENVDVVASVDLDTVTGNSESISENAETNEEEENVGNDIISDPVKNFTGYRVYRVIIPTEEVIANIL